MALRVMEEMGKYYSEFDCPNIAPPHLRSQKGLRVSDVEDQ